MKPTAAKNYLILISTIPLEIHPIRGEPIAKEYSATHLSLYNKFKSGKVVFCKILFFLGFFLLLNTSKIQAQQNINYALYANIIYRFTKYIDWPAEKKSGDFVIGLVGDSPLYEDISSFTANKLVGKQKIIIKKFSSSATSYSCHVLFISGEERRSLKRIVAITNEAPVLLITEMDGFALKGSCINFIIVNDHLKLEINKNNIERRNLKVASEFLALGTIVD